MKTVNYNNATYDKKIKVEHLDVASFPFELTVYLGNSQRADCRIGHVGFNFWFRTHAGTKGKRYTSAKRLERAVERTCERYGFKVLGWV